ncbi:DUF4145 domain-containing protein [Acinetobacter johnsonii]|uniref:DUF4145 domain-containing protein n=1 Tax=Acinetobacter johnsonii TaxID=40214 RepID=UPI0024497E29|nr:DUF4145 domain-containing protein [Acinetobacter johnsonii]MDH0836235.1 DUF4145 domain-containing protein [Acinetobacter johnsonii]MDH0839771.1 DUF4145 domain-containing protein [Acinetobacter johnsonii]
MRVYVDKNSNVEANKTEIFDQCLCVKCKIEIKQSVIVNIADSEDHGECTLYKNYKILRCINCESITYKNEVVNSEEVFQIGEEYDGTPIYEDNAQIQLYPIRDEGTAFSKEFEKILPEEIYSTYEEVIIALNNKMPLLTALGLRTLLEQIIKYFGKSDDLGVILNQFEQDGFISTKQRGLLDDIRYLGNDAAHRVDSKSRKDLILHLKVLENLIHQLFVYYKLEDEASKKY